LTRTDLANGSLLKRGDPVMLVSRVGGVEVRMSGRALRWCAELQR
jgi:flagella basal body P-ring formation protein FlgA